MAEETPYRIALVAVLASTLPVIVYYRLRAASGETISRREEGIVLAIMIRLGGLTMWIALAWYLYDPTSILLPLRLPSAVRWAGAPLAALCPLAMYWTLSSLGKNLTDTVVTRQAATLVVAGPYRYVRHPFYASAALLMLSATLLSSDLLLALAGAGTLALLAVRTPEEERRLEERFGDDYRQYRARTGRFVPRWRRAD